MSSLRHPDWHLFAEQRFRRRGAVEVSEQVFRGQPYIVLADKLTGQYLRLAEGARDLWQALDGRRRAQDIWEDWMRSPATAPTQSELVSWLMQLVQQGFVLSDHGLDPRTLGLRRSRQRSSQIEQRAASPLAIRVALFDPDPLVRLFWPLLRFLFTPIGGMAILAIFALAGLLAARNADALRQGADAALLSQSGLIGLALVYPVMKAIHELAHCLALYRFGGRVHEFGVMLLVLFPVPYVEASESLALPDKRARMLVAAAGILAEMLMAAIALFLWLMIEPGLERAILFNVMVIGSVSTLLFNGNPLLKFDAYYVLTDWLELPNLAIRGGAWMADGFGHRILGLRRTFTAEPGETPVLALYGPLSLVYRLLLTFTIAFLVSGWFFVIGILLGLWALITGILWPLAKTARKWWETARSQARLPLAFWRLAIFLLLAYGALFMVPLPFTVTGSGKILPIAETRIVVAGSGRIAPGVLPDGTQVAEGQTLLTLSDPEGAARLASLTAGLAYLDDTLQRSGLSAVERQLLERERSVTRDTLDEAARTAAATRLSAPRGGRLVWTAGITPLPGSHLYRGLPLGHILSANGVEAVAAIPAAFSGLGRERMKAVEMRLPDGTRLPLRPLRDQVVDTGGSAPPELLVSAGGPVPENPESPGRTLDAVWLLWSTADRDLSPWAGMRFDLRIDLGTAPAAHQIALFVQRLFLRALRL